MVEIPPNLEGDMKFKSIAVFIPVVLAGGSAAFGTDWQHYVNVRFGTSADVPATFLRAPPPDNGDGQQFTSSDGGSITVFGSMNPMAGSLADYRRFLKDVLEDDGWTLSYAPEGRNWFVLSGNRDGEILYHRVEHRTACGADLLHHIEFRYPGNRATAWSAVIEHGAATLDGPCE